METINTFAGWDGALPESMEELAQVLCDKITEACSLTNLGYRIDGTKVTVCKFDADESTIYMTGTGLFAGNILLTVDFGRFTLPPTSLELETFQISPGALFEVRQLNLAA